MKERKKKCNMLYKCTSILELADQLCKEIWEWMKQWKNELMEYGNEIEEMHTTLYMYKMIETEIWE